MKKDKVRFACLGCGRISSAHLDAIKNVDTAELAAVCDIDERKAREAALGYGLEKWYTSFDEMLSNEDIDVVNICTPSGLHSEHTIAAAKKGKHVLCEKPIGITKDQIDRMLAACKKEGVIFGAIFQRRTSLAAIHTRNIIQQGKLGKLVLASAYLKYYRSQEYYDSDDWRGTWKLDGGGALMNQGIHGIDLLQWMVGDVEKLYARCRTISRRIEVEDTAVINVKFRNGSIGVIECATSVYPGQDTIFSIHGEKGTISFGDEGFYKWCVEGEDENPPEAGGGLGGINCGWTDTNNGHILQVANMVQAVIHCTEPMVTGEDARKAVGIILAAYESSMTGNEIFL